MSSDAIVTRSEGAVRIVTIRRPEKKNALTFAMYDAMTAALRAADEDDSVRVVLLTGDEGNFTAGNDAGDFIAIATGQAREQDGRAAIRFLLQLADQRKPLLVAVDGPAVGIGTTMLLHADHVVASARARFHLPFTPLGLSPEGASSLLLPLVVGAARANQWLLFGDPFDAATARDAGLIHEVVPAEELVPAALGRARALAERPPGAVLAAKRLLRDPLRAQVRETIEREAQVFYERLASQEARDALTSFLQRRR